MNTDSTEADTHENTKKRWLFSITLTAWLLLIFGTSCTVIRPLEFFELIQNFTGSDRTSMERFAVFWGITWFAIVKGWHFTEFAILTFLCVGVIKWCRGFIDSGSIFGAMVFCFAFAASDEFHQSFVPDPFGTAQDVLIDSLGVCSAGSIMLLRLKKKMKREPINRDDLGESSCDSPSRVLGESSP